MLDLQQSLHNQDQGFLQIVADLWEVSLDVPDVGSMREKLAAALLEPGRAAEMAQSLPAEGREALDDLLRSGGKLPWALFTRRHGEVREMGPGRRDRQRPHLNPVSGAEVLWYRALVARAFLDTPDGPQEHACIPTDLQALLPEPEPPTIESLGRSARPDERKVAIPVTDRILDHACSMLAGLRIGFSGFSAEKLDEIFSSWKPSGAYLPHPITPAAMQELLDAIGLLDANDIPIPDLTRHFLELPRSRALAHLVRAWTHSPDFNELRLLPGLVFEGEWQNDPLRARYAILDLLVNIPADTWWSLGAFVSDIKQVQPDFQRPAGDYDSWYIRSEASEEHRRGFEHWDEVDGALVRFLITGPLHWLGVLDLAAPAPDAAPTAFRFSRWAEALLAGAPPEGMDEEDETFLISSDARIRVPRRVPRSARYQLARFSEWERQDELAYHYRLTPRSLESAKDQGLRVVHLLALLRRYALAVPPSLTSALERWQEHGSEMRIERVSILRVRNPDMLQMLRSSRAGRFLGEPLGPTTIIVHEGAWEKVLTILTEMGYLGEAAIDLNKFAGQERYCFSRPANFLPAHIAGAGEQVNELAHFLVPGNLLRQRRSQVVNLSDRDVSSPRAAAQHLGVLGCQHRQAEVC